MMRTAYKLLSKAFPVVGCAIIVYWAHARRDVIFQGSQLSNGVRLTYTSIFTFAMEYISRYLHLHLWHCKYLWWIHGSHHHQYPAIGSKPTYDHGLPFVSPAVEMNDMFAVFFATVATCLMWAGVDDTTTLAKDCSVGMGIGVTLYGFSYFLGHDIVGHERCGKEVARFLRNQWPYLDRCARIHVQYHHKVKKRDDDDDPYGPPYGFWLGPQEIKCLAERGETYVPMPIVPKLLVWTAVCIHLAAAVVG